jgi:hypothetical protein
MKLKMSNAAAESIYKLASKIDIGLTLAEATGDLIQHKIVVDPETSTINVYCVPNNSIKNIKFNLKLPSPDKSSK